MTNNVSFFAFQISAHLPPASIRTDNLLMANLSLERSKYDPQFCPINLVWLYISKVVRDLIKTSLIASFCISLLLWKTKDEQPAGWHWRNQRLKTLLKVQRKFKMFSGNESETSPIEKSFSLSFPRQWMYSIMNGLHIRRVIQRRFFEWNLSFSAVLNGKFTFMLSRSALIHRTERNLALLSRIENKAIRELFPVESWGRKYISGSSIMVVSSTTRKRRLSIKPLMRNCR